MRRSVRFLAQRVKFALWNFARLHPFPGALIRAVARFLLSDAEDLRKKFYTRDWPAVAPQDGYGRDHSTSTQAWLLRGEDSLAVSGTAMLLNHLRIPFRTGAINEIDSGASVVFAVGTSSENIHCWRHQLPADTALFVFGGNASTSSHDVQKFESARDFLPNSGGLRSPLAATVSRALRDHLRRYVVTGKLPAVAGLRIDDVEAKSADMWLPVMCAFNWKPNLGIFLDAFANENPNAALLAQSAQYGACDLSPHAFNAAKFLLYNYPWGRPYARAEFETRWREAMQCFERNNFPLSPVINAHFHVLSRSAAEVMAAQGARYFFSELEIDRMAPKPSPENWPSGDATECTGRADPSGVFQLSSGDNILDVMNVRSDYDFMMHGGAYDPEQAAARILRRLNLSLDCGFPAYVTSHEYLFAHWPAEWHRRLWQLVEEGLAKSPWSPQKASLGEIAAAAEAARLNNIVSVETTDSGVLKVAINGSGSADQLTVLGRGIVRNVPVPAGMGERTVEINVAEMTRG